jgi:lipid II:glycine glycyltransferase (peptidoglycan interpeptide bridge formation enzyme)
MIKFITRPILARRLAEIDQERDRVEEAMVRARKQKKRTSELFEYAKELQKKRAKLERWL